MSTFIPNSDRVLIKIDDTVMTAGGLHIPQSAKSGEARLGTIEAKGIGRFVNGHLIPVPFEVGDRIVLDTVGGIEVKINGVAYVICRSEDVLGRIIT